MLIIYTKNNTSFSTKKLIFTITFIVKQINAIF